MSEVIKQDLKTEALKLALEGLEKWHFDKDPRGADQYITAIREALAEQPAQGCEFCSHPLYAATKCKHCGKPAQQDIPKIGCVNHDCDKCKAQQQEPVGAVYRYGKDSSGKPWHGVCWTASGLDLPDGTLIYTSPQSSKPLTDDPLQGAVDWLLEADGEYFCTATVQRTLRIGYNRAKRLCDTAKERAAHGIKGGA